MSYVDNYQDLKPGVVGGVSTTAYSTKSSHLCLNGFRLFWFVNLFVYCTLIWVQSPSSLTWFIQSCRPTTSLYPWDLRFQFISVSHFCFWCESLCKIAKGLTPIADLNNSGFHFPYQGLVLCHKTFIGLQSFDQLWAWDGFSSFAGAVSAWRT